MIPIKKGITGTDIPNIAVETSDSTIPRKPILVEGGPAPEPITVTALSVTENGSYNAGENAAYNPVTVNVDKSKPDYVELSDFDFKTATLYDSIRNFTPNQTTQVTNIGTSTDGAKFNATNSSINSAIALITNCFYEIKIKFGTNDKTSTINQYNSLFKLNRADSHQTLTYVRDKQVDDNPVGTWRVNDAGSGQFLSVGYGDPYYFNEKELVILFGYYFENGKFTVNYNKFAYYLEDVLIYKSSEAFPITHSDHIPIITLGGSNVMQGTIIESLKVKQIFKWDLDISLLKNLVDKESEV